jgi:hypothetical protein
MTLDQLKAALENNFGPPFLPEGHVRVKFATTPGEPTLAIFIGRRDIWLTEDGRVTGAGTGFCGDVLRIPPLPRRGGEVIAWWRDTFRLWAAAGIAGAIFAIITQVTR